MSNPSPSPTPTKGRGRPKKEVQGIQKIGSFFKSGEKSNAGGKTRATKGKTRATKGKTSSFSSKAKQNQKEPQPPEIKRKPIASPKKITHKDDDDESNVGDERESQEDYRYDEDEDEEYYDDDEDVELVGDEEDDLEEEEDLKETHDNSASLTNSNLKIKIKLSSSNPNLNVSNQNVNIPEVPTHLSAQNQRTLKMINLNLPFQFITQFYKENTLLRLGAMEAAQGHFPLESFNLKQLGTLKEQLRSIRDGIDKINTNVSNQLSKIDNITKMSESKTGDEMEDEGSNKVTILKEEEYDLKGIDQPSTSHPSSAPKQTRKRQKNDTKDKNSSQNIIIPTQPSTPLVNNPNLFNPNLSNNNLSSVHLSSSSTSLPSSLLKKESNDDALSPSNEMILNDDDDEKITKKSRNSENKKKKKTRGRAKQMRKKKKDRNKNTDDEMDYLDDLDDDDTKKGSPGYYNHANFWIHMKPYVQPITNDHLAFLQPTETANDPIFDIPTLGVKSKDSKKSNNNLSLNRNSTTGVKTTVTPITTKTKSGTSQPPNPESIDCGELTSRIFSALVQEKIIPETKKKLKYRFKKSELFQDYPVPYSEKATETIEERIRSELSDIGLIDMFSTPNASINNTNNTPSPSVVNISAPSPSSIETDKDDENVTELKELQQKLLQQININNQNKKEILQLATQHMRREQQLELIQKERANVEKIFSNAFPKIKKKKK